MKKEKILLDHLNQQFIFYNMKIMLNITEKEILKGIRGNPLCCPVALALYKSIPMAKDIQVTYKISFFR